MNLIETFPPDTLLRVACCSEANFSSWADPRGSEVEVARILYPAPRTAHHESIGGIFHAGNRYYLQCLEGPVEHLAWYLEHLEQDDRHQRVELILSEPIQSQRFPPGSMRYVGSHKELQAIQTRHGLSTFDPYTFTPEALADFIDLAFDRPSDPAALMGVHRD